MWRRRDRGGDRRGGVRAEAAAVERNLIGYFSTWAGMPDSGWADRDDVTYLFTGAAIPFLNRVLRAKLPHGQVDAGIDRVRAEIALLPHPLVWQVGPSTEPPDLGRRLRQHGFLPAGRAPGMTASVRSSPNTRIPPELRIESVDDEDALRAWFGPLAPEIGIPAEVVADAARVRSRHRLAGGAGFRHFLGRIGGVPIASASLYVQNRVAGVYDVATLPAWRRRGVASALTAACLDEARSLGLETAVLQASRLAVRLYERLGFRRCCVLRVYRAP